jgi:hypothetical protein
VAYARRALDVSGLAVDAKGRKVPEILAVGRLRATSIVKGFADAIVWSLVARCFGNVKCVKLVELVDVDDDNPFAMIGPDSRASKSPQ